MTKCFLVIAVVAIGSMGTARAAVPAWCNVDGASSPGPNNVDGIYSQRDAREAVYRLAWATCYPDDNTKPQEKQLEATRQAWSKKLDMTDADWRDAVHWMQFARRERDIQPRSDRAAWSAYSPIDQYALMLVAGDADPSYLADAFGAKLSETGRLAFILVCLREGDDAPVRWAVCAPDITALDRKRLSTELREDATHNGSHRMLVRFALFELDAALTAHAAEVKALQTKEPAYARVFALAASTRAAWAPDAALVARATQLDDARVTGSRKASDGCEEGAWSAWKSTVSAMPAKVFSDLAGEAGYDRFPLAMVKVTTQPNGYLAALAVVQCAVLTSRTDYGTNVIAETIRRMPGFRGPRTAGLSAILTSGITLDQRDAKLEMPEVTRAWLAGDGNSTGGATGAIAKLDRAGEMTTITFAKEAVTQTVCKQGRTGNRISHINPDGRFVYEYICTKWVTETIHVPPSQPLKVRTRYAAGLSVGMAVTVATDTVTFAYAKPKSTAVVMVAGVGVK